MKKERLSSKVKMIVALNFLAVFLFLCILQVNRLKENLVVVETKISQLSRKDKAFDCQSRNLRKRVERLCNRTNGIEHSLTETVDEQNDILTQLDFTSMLEDVLPGVVSINVYEVDQYTGEMGYTVYGAGHLFCVERGYVITARHVMSYRNSTVELDSCFVEINGEKVEVLDAYLDPNEDFAILLVDVNDPNYCPTKQLRLSDEDVEVGQIVFNIGHPWQMPYSVSMGIVSVVRSEHTNFGVYTGRGPIIRAERVQYDAASNPGNSGGVLVNLAGEVIGMSVSGLNLRNNNSGVNFAVPVDSMERCLARFELWLAKAAFQAQLEECLLEDVL